MCAGAGTFAACSPPDYCIGETCIVLHDDVIPWNDIDDYLPAMRAITATTYGDLATAEAFTVDVELFPRTHTLMLMTTQGEMQVECGALWERPIIKATVVGTITAEGCLPHEFWQHRLPHALGFGWNDDHSDHWRLIDLSFRRRLESPSPPTEPPSAVRSVVEGYIVAPEFMSVGVPVGSR